MAKYRKYNWRQLFVDFEQSGLSQAAFCKQNDLNAKYFSLKRSNYKAEVVSKDSAFARVSVAPNAALDGDFILEFGRCKVYCPQSLSAASIANLVRALA